MKIRLMLFLAIVLGLVACGDGGVAATSGSEDENGFRIPLAALDSGQAQYFEAESGDKTIRFFAMQSSDGEYRAAFDACDVCYEAQKGYRQDGEFMVCNNCGQKFHSARINEVKGGCNPAPLKRVVEGDHLVIAKSDIAQGASYF